MGDDLIDPRTDIDNAYEDPDSLFGGGFVKGDGWEKGLTAIEAGEEIGAGIKSGDWIEAGLGVAGVALDAASATFDPIGYAAGQLTSWMLEHLEPLRKVLHGLTGEPNMVKGYAASWEHIAERMSSVSEDYLAALERDTKSWTGDAATGYRDHAEHIASLAEATSVAATTLATSAEMASELVVGVRTMVRDMIAALVGWLVNAVIELAASLGAAAPLVIEQSLLEIARTSGRVAKVLIKLGHTISKLAVYLVALRDMLDGVYKELRALAESKQ